MNLYLTQLKTMIVHFGKKIYSNNFQDYINKYLFLHFSEMYDLSLSTQDITQRIHIVLVFVIKLR